MRVRLLAGVLLAVILAMSACSNGSGAGSGPGSGGTKTGTTPAPKDAATRFLSRYVTSDGRVLRRDQGSDIVSESQAYGMLIAQLAGQAATVRTIWRWTKAHLSRPDGLLAFHASGDGGVIDPNPAADADTLAAYALLRYRGPDQASLSADGRRIATAILAHETASAGGQPVIVAGTWATGSPATVNPSYWMPGIFGAIGKMTGDDRWSAAASTAVPLVQQLTDNGRRLPPDWAQLDGDRLTPSNAPDGSSGIRYSLDAARLPLWFAASCTGSARDLAAAWWRVLAPDDRAASQALSVDGSPVDPTASTVPLLAAAAAAEAASDANRSRALTQRAVQQTTEHPTYYGDAWLALAGALSRGQLESCQGSH
jgi:endoglucanase